MTPSFDEFLHASTAGIDCLPNLLPSSHLRDSRHLDKLLNDNEVPLWRCEVFKEDLVYLFYGGVFYRTSAIPTNEAAYFPIALVFAPEVLASVHRVYPFDTGAANSRKYGEWSDKLHPFTRYQVTENGDGYSARRLVQHFFGGNKAYLTGEPLDPCHPNAGCCSVLHQFLATNLTKLGVDQRYRRIEAHARVPLSLDRVIWVGYPEHLESEMIRLKLRLKLKHSDWYAYEVFPATPPSEVTMHLQYKVHEEIIPNYVEKQRPAA